MSDLDEDDRGIGNRVAWNEAVEGITRDNVGQLWLGAPETGAPQDTKTDPTHGDLSGDVELLQWQLDRAREEIRLLRGRAKAPLRFCGEGQAPTKAYDGDAGFDLYVAPNLLDGGGWVVRPGEFVDIDTGISVELPPGVWAMMVGRSSTARRGLMVAQAVIDNGYRGPLFFGLQNLTQSTVVIEPGERLAQLVPFQLTAANMEVTRVATLTESERGVRGFGSSGR